MAEGWTTKRTSSELNVDLSTLQRWRKAGSGPAWKYNKDGECIYLASAVREWGSTHVHNPWEDDSEMAGQHVVAQKLPAQDQRTGGPQKLRDLWPSYNHLGEVTYFSTPEAAKREYDHRTGYAAEQGLPKMPPFPPVTQAALGSTTPSPAAVREIADNPHGFTLPERKPK